jgi:ornithine lipid hydroxylase
MRALISRHLLWLSVCASVAAYSIARAVNGPLEAVVTLSSLVVLMLAAGLERWMPYRPEWNRSSGDARTDLTSAAVLIGAVDPLLKAALPVALIAVWPAAAQVDAAAHWAHDVPFALQVVAALLWIELAKYGAHRWHHTNRGLWWLHALHHGSRRLYTLNNFRFHPLNHAINQGLAIGPLLLAGVPADVLLACLAITQPVLMLQHANIDLRSGWLNRVFSSNETHRWHHSASVAEANCNFGSALLLWDHVFGTWRAAGTEHGPSAIGLFGDGGHYPATRSYLAQLGSMFGPACCRT